MSALRAVHWVVPAYNEAASIVDLIDRIAAVSAEQGWEWDLLVVDEAHHLAWSERGSSPEYDTIATLAAASRGLLLLTATPEQVGIEGHFARLRLLDPARFHDLQSFLREERGYRHLNQLLDAITASPAELPGPVREQLRQLLGNDAAEAAGGPEADGVADHQSVRMPVPGGGQDAVHFPRPHADEFLFPHRGAWFPGLLCFPDFF